MSRTIKLEHTDDYRRGPKLHLLKETTRKTSKNNSTDDSSENVDQMREIQFVEFPISKKYYYVYYLCLEIADYGLTLLKKFKHKSDAIIYAKRQYKLHTGEYPFIQTGTDCNYASIGERLKIDMGPYKGKQSDIEGKCESTNDGYEYIVIIRKKFFESHSLNPCAEW